MPELEKKIKANLENLEKKQVNPLETEKKEIIEKKSEKILEQDSSIERQTEVYSDDQVSTSTSDQHPGPISKRLKEAIDDILEENLEDIYLNMSPTEQKVFKEKGEETTNKIVSLLNQAKVKVKKIVKTIIGWLKMISGVNKFFIQQTAKIKTDKILEAKEKIDKEVN